MFSVNAGNWFGFHPFPDGVCFPEVETTYPNKKLIKFPGIWPGNEEEERILRVFSALPDHGKNTIRVAVDVAIAIQKEYEGVVDAVIKRRPLSDKEAKVWNYLRGMVISGEFYPLEDSKVTNPG